ncbi:MAG: hypothetical protein U0872_07975 [Planctomycetaceae bacterium]
MAHSHLVIQHLLKQLEQKSARKEERDCRPEWLSSLIVRLASRFEPFGVDGRVGFVCEPGDVGWTVRMYLGTTEIVGGKDDGEWRQSGFELDVGQFISEFTRLDEIRWSVSAPAADGSHSFVTLQGAVGEHVVQVKVYSRTPRDAGPAFRQHLDGTVETVG